MDDYLSFMRENGFPEAYPSNIAHPETNSTWQDVVNSKHNIAEDFDFNFLCADDEDCKHKTGALHRVLEPLGFECLIYTSVIQSDFR